MTWAHAAHDLMWLGLGMASPILFRLGARAAEWAMARQDRQLQLPLPRAKARLL